MPPLTIFTTVPSELGLDYLRIYREALLRWNREGLAETQVILLPQRPLCGMSVDPFEIVETDYEMVDGYPVWDLMRAVRQAWPLVRGDYVSFDHPEFLWGPGRLKQTIAWLTGIRPVYGLGNLRRTGIIEDSYDKNARDNFTKKTSDWFRGRFLDLDKWDEAAEAFDHIATSHWMVWQVEQKPGPVPWQEDVFYAEKAWLDAWGFARYDPEMPFQDVYDLMQKASWTMQQFGIGVLCQRMPQSVNRLLHLWHPRTWASFSPAMRDWFLSQPERWASSAFGNPKLWADLMTFSGAPLKQDYRPVNRLRFGPRGTALNYACQLTQWLQNGGVEGMQEYFQQRSERMLAD